MSWVAAAIVGGSVVSGFIGAEGSRDAASIGAGASDRAALLQKQAYDTTRADLGPYRDVGTPALARLMHLSGLKTDAGAAGGEFGSLLKPFAFSQADMFKDPGYQFRLKEGEKAIQRGALARGMDASTPTLKSLSRFSSDLASQEYGGAFGRALTVDTTNKQQPFNVLSYLAGTGQNAAAMTGQAGINTAAGMANSVMAGGAAGAQGALGQASAWNNAIQGGISNYMYQQRFDQMMARMPVFSNPNAFYSPGNYGYSGTTGLSTQY